MDRRKSLIPHTLGASLLCLCWFGECHADVYNCDKGYTIVYQEAPCNGGINLTADASVQTIIKASGPKTFFKEGVAPPPYQPARPENLVPGEPKQFFSSIVRACSSGNYNQFYSLFTYRFRRVFNKLSPEELAHRMGRYCRGDYASEKITNMLTNGSFKMRASRSKEAGVNKGELCWSSSATEDQCKFIIEMAVENGRLVRDEL